MTLNLTEHLSYSIEITLQLLYVNISHETYRFTQDKNILRKNFLSNIRVNANVHALKAQRFYPIEKPQIIPQIYRFSLLFRQILPGH